MQKKLTGRYLRILFDIKMSQNVGVKKTASGSSKMLLLLMIGQNRIIKL